MGKYGVFALFDINGAFNWVLNPKNYLGGINITFLETLGHFLNLAPSPGGLPGG